MSDPKQIADELERLCCAETEGAFFDYVTEAVGSIQKHLRECGKLRASLQEIYVNLPRLTQGQISEICRNSGVAYGGDGSCNMRKAEHEDILDRLHEYAKDWRTRAGSAWEVADAMAEIRRLRTALDLICSLVQPMGRRDSDLGSAQRIASEALNKKWEPET